MASQILSIRIDEPRILRRSYMPFLTHGGLYVELPGLAEHRPEPRRLPQLHLNDSVCLLLQLYETSERLFSISKVVWIGPKQSRHQAHAFGLGFSAEDKTLKSLLEARLRDLEPLTETPLTL